MINDDDDDEEEDDDDDDEDDDDYDDDADEEEDDDDDGDGVFDGCAAAGGHSCADHEVHTYISLCIARLVDETLPSIAGWHRCAHTSLTEEKKATRKGGNDSWKGGLWSWV